jgi:tryptophanyl-tRNA synthetase
VADRLAPITSEFRRLKADSAYVENVLRQGAAEARNVTSATLAEVYQAVGFLQFPNA